MRRYINEGLAEFLESSPVPWHMPGHKRKRVCSAENNKIDKVLNAVSGIDVTEVPGTDDLYEPEDMILASLGELKKIYGSSVSYYMVNGATGGVLTAMYAARKYSGGNKFIIAKNCHKSVYNAVSLMGLSALFVEPESYGVTGHVDVSKVWGLCEREKPVAMVITSPSYDGVVSDISSIAGVLHEHGAILIVDEAHGAHLPFIDREDFPKSAIKCGADIVVESLHKTLPAMTQTAVIHVMRDELVACVRDGLQIFMSSSPSYVMLGSMENAIAWASEKDFNEYLKLIDTFREKCKTFKRLHVLEPEEVMRNGAFAYDTTRLVITTNGEGISGIELAGMLRTDYNIVVEMAGANNVVLISTAMDEENDFRVLYEALFDIDSRLLNEAVKRSRAEGDKAKTLERIRRLEGTIAENNLYVYPPGSYIVRQGETITKENVKELLKYASAGLHIRGL